MYRPPTRHNNYDNSHLIVANEEGVLKPKPEYQAYADRTNEQLAQSGSDDRLMWDDATTSFVLRSLLKEAREEGKES